MIGVGYEVVRDLYDVASRVKEIDDGYFIFYSYRYHRYEVHHRRQKGNTLCLVVPYDRLDARTVELVRKTRVENADRLLREAQAHNEKLERDKKNSVIASSGERLEHYLKNA